MSNESANVTVDAPSTEKRESENTKADATEKQEEKSIYIRPLQNRLVIEANQRGKIQRLSFYLNRSRKILRSGDTLVITGIGKAISLTCTLVELLKRQKIAKVTKLVTNMNLNPNFFRRGGGLAWERPVPAIVIHLTRGEHATLVTDYQQRKVIEIFENRDSEHTGKLSKKVVEEMGLAEAFLSTPQQQETAKEFLDKIAGSDVHLPDFIHYCSILIHPLLKESLFRANLGAFGITSHEPEAIEKGE